MYGKKHSGRFQPDIMEAVGLKEALSWIIEANLSNLITEIDAQ